MNRGRPIVAGLFRSASGIGESARLCADTLDELGFEPVRIDLTGQFGQRDLLPVHVPSAPPPPDHGPVIIHINPPELEAATAFLGRKLMRERLIIGYWVWELSEIPDSWIERGKYVHEVWTPSHFCAEAINRKIMLPVRVVPHPVHSPAGKFNRSKFNLPADAVVVLTIVDIRSSITRKNLDGAIAVFHSAFNELNMSTGSALFVVKLGGGTSNLVYFDKLTERLRRHPNVCVLTENFSVKDKEDLIASSDIYISLHRSEGFGLVIAESMLAGKPVLVTDWSGSQEFTDAESAALVPARAVAVKDDQGIYPEGTGMWAEPDPVIATTKLKRLLTDSEWRMELGVRGRAHCQELLDQSAYHKALSESFRNCAVRSSRQ